MGDVKQGGIVIPAGAIDPASMNPDVVWWWPPRVKADKGQLRAAFAEERSALARTCWKSRTQSREMTKLRIYHCKRAMQEMLDDALQWDKKAEADDGQTEG